MVKKQNALKVQVNKKAKPIKAITPIPTQLKFNWAPKAREYVLCRFCLSRMRFDHLRKHVMKTTHRLEVLQIIVSGT
jgi:hypothetical protein